MIYPKNYTQFMTFLSKYTLFITAGLVLFTACKSSEFSGYSYDPEGVTDTETRVITPQHKRTIGFMEDGVWFTNEFKGARISDAYRVGKLHYKLIIDPEIAPINSSSWYGFKVWSQQPQNITVEMEYPEGRQRYIPKLSRNKGKIWSFIDSTKYTLNNGNGLLELDVDSDTLWVTAQEIETTNEFNDWLSSISLKSFVQTSVAGSSHQGRPVKMIKMSQYSDVPVKGVVIVYGRQHPPEIPGYLVGLHFLDALAADTELAQKFRTYFDVWAFPMMNPDGADNGHWRTNAGGIDLNRDWQYFNQPETAAVQQALLPLKNRQNRKVFYGVDFHSTSYNVLYPIEKDENTFPLHYTYRWADQLIEELPNVEIRIEPFPTDSPIAKNWTYHTFGSDAVTFEVWDEMPRDQLKEFGTKAAEIFMKDMIEEYRKEFGEEAENPAL